MASTSSALTVVLYIDIINTVKKACAKGAYYVIAGTFTTKFVAFFGSIFLVRILTKTDYGVLSYYENLYSYFLLAAGLGLAGGLLRYIVLAESKGKKKYLYKFSLYEGERYNAILLIVFIAFCLLFPHQDDFRDFSFVGVILVAVIPFQYLLNLNLSSLRGMFDYKSYALISIVTSMVLVVARVIGALLWGLCGTVLLRLIAEGVCAIACVSFVLTKHFKNATTENANELVKPFKTYSLQIMFTDGLWALFMLNDVLLLSFLTGDAVMVADYKTAYVIPANLSILSSAIGIFVAPYFTKKSAENNYRWIGSNLFKLECVTLALMLVSAIICALLAEPIISILFGQQYVSCLPAYYTLLVMSVINNGIRYPIANTYSAIGLQKINLQVAAVGIAIQLFTDFALIPQLGTIGAASGSALAQLVMSLLLVIDSIRRFVMRRKNDGPGIPKV